jgi:amino acid adenylation domain-containing protein
MKNPLTPPSRTAIEDQLLNQRLFPVSFAQRQLLFLDQLDPESSAYNLTRAMRIIGQLDTDALTDTLNAIVQRHSSLRTTFTFAMEDGYQIINDKVEFRLPVLDISHLPGADRMTEAMRLVRDEGHKRFDLASAPLVRSVLVRLAPTEHVLVFVMHHIITDGWSMSILFDEIGEIYSEIKYGKPAELPALSIQFLDVARCQREVNIERHVMYWTNKLKDHAGFMELPTDRPRPALQSHEGAIERFEIGEELVGALSRLATSNSSTLFMVLTAAFQTLLFRYTSSEDILIGTPVAARKDPQTEKIIGLFVNTLVIRGDCSGNPSFLELLRRTRETTLEAYEHQDLPFDKLVEVLNPQRSLSYTPLFQVMFVFHNTPKQKLNLPGLSSEELEFDQGSAKFDLTLEIEEQDGLRCSVEYCTALFEKESIRRLSRHFKNLLGDIARNPNRALSEFCILDEAERNELIFRFNSMEYRRNVRIEQIFAEQVEQTPDRVALVEGESEITYGDLSKRVDALAGLLLQFDLNQERPVGVYMERSIDCVVAFLAALKANTPYVPLDISNPRDRLELLISDAGCDVILTHRGLLSALPEHVKKISLDDLALAESSDVHSAVGGSSEDLAYIIYTSGSTGFPKGVEGSHRAAINRFEWMWRTYPFTENETCCQKTALGFVDSVWEIFGPLLCGVRTVIVPDECLLDSDQFVALLARHDVTRIVLVPSLLRTLLNCVPDLATRLPRLRFWSVSGETLPSNVVREFRQMVPTATLLNIYGSAEVTADVTCYEVESAEFPTPIPIGKPINNAQIFVLDQHKNLVPPLVRGELYVGGDCLARGYWRKPELTSQRFISNPYRPDQSRFIFATGDLGRCFGNGTIEHLGRVDRQVKLRGIRIELGEIETNLSAHPCVRDCVVTTQGDLSETKHLIAHVVSDRPGPLTDELRRFLRARLPEYMIPTFFIELDHMPLLASGKINLMALPGPRSEANGKRRPIVRGRTDIESRLHSIWQEVLKIDQIGIDDNFFDLGGHSLGAMRVLARVRRDFHVDVPIRTLFDKPTIEGLAAEVEDRLTIPPVTLNTSTFLNALRTELRALSPHQVDAFLQSVLMGNNAEGSRRN